MNVDNLSRGEFDAHNSPRLTLNHHGLTWDPSTTIYEDHENEMLNYKGDIVCPDVTSRGTFMVVKSVCMSTCEDDADILSDDNFSNVLQSNVNVSHINIMKTNNVSRLSYADSTLVNTQ